MVGVAQLVEPRIVIPVVEGSSPFIHPIFIFAFHLCSLKPAHQPAFFMAVHKKHTLPLMNANKRKCYAGGGQARQIHRLSCRPGFIKSLY